MDGENNGKPHEQMDDLGWFSHYFWVGLPIWITKDHVVPRLDFKLVIKRVSSYMPRTAKKIQKDICAFVIRFSCLIGCFSAFSWDAKKNSPKTTVKQNSYTVPKNPGACRLEVESVKKKMFFLVFMLGGHWHPGSG